MTLMVKKRRFLKETQPGSPSRIGWGRILMELKNDIWIGCEWETGRNGYSNYGYFRKKSILMGLIDFEFIKTPKRIKISDFCRTVEDGVWSTNMTVKQMTKGPATGMWRRPIPEGIIFTNIG